MLPKYAILPIGQPEAQVMLNGTPMDVRLAVNKVDYTVPFPLHAGAERLARYPEPGTPTPWLGNIELADTFDTANREKFRPIYHHTPAYGWMNDANGLVYKDGEYHLYFQYNPYGSSGATCTGDTRCRRTSCTGHTSGRLVHTFWATYSRARAWLTTTIRGSFGKDAIIAFYTLAQGAAQQYTSASSSALLTASTTGALTLNTKSNRGYTLRRAGEFPRPEGVLVCTAKQMVMIVSADKNMRFYESKKTLKWSYMSEWGAGYGPQPV